MATDLEKNAAVPGSSGMQSDHGRGARAFGVRLVGVLLLALGLGLGYAGVVSGLYEPFAEATPGTVTVEHCSHNDGKRSPEECEGVFTSTDGKIKDPYADIPTDDPYPEGHHIDALQIGGDSYGTSVVSAVASGLRYLFGGFCALGPAFFCLFVGRWPGPRAAGTLRSMHPAFSWITFPMVGIGLVGLLVAGIVR